MNATLAKFGHPASLIRDYTYWCVLLRPSQATLGALVLAAKSDVEAFAHLPADAFVELHRVTGDIEVALHGFRPFDRINYLMLMMVDPHVHFHVLPRYASPQPFAGTTCADAGWPGPPDLKSALPLTGDQHHALRDELRALWPHA